MIHPLDQFKATYFTEAAELVEEMERCLLTLERTPQDSEALGALFRAVHSIKGGALAFGFEALVRFTHVVETRLDQWRSGEVHISDAWMDGLLQARDVIATMLAAAQEERSLPDAMGDAVLALLHPVADAQVMADFFIATFLEDAVIQELALDAVTTYDIVFIPQPELLLSGNDPLRLFAALRNLGTLSVTADVSAVPDIAALDPTLLYLRWHLVLSTTAAESAIEEVFEFVRHLCTLTITPRVADATSPAVVTAPSVAESSGTKTAATATATTTTLRVETAKIDLLMNMVSELLMTQSMLSARMHEAQRYQGDDLSTEIETLGRQSRALQEAVLSIRMQPVKALFARMPRVVRDTAHQLGKEVTLVMEGEHTEIDSSVMEKLADPLSHMIRNAVDHGIEVAAVRVAAGKPAQGVLRLSATTSSGRVLITLSDDGAGLNRARILEKAIARGQVSPEKNLSEQEIDQLIFLPGFSTADAVTNLSGRGVGLDVVRKNIESIGGTVRLSHRPGAGTCLTLSLPLTLASLDGMVVQVGAEHYVLPIASMVESLRPQPADRRTLHGSQQMLQVRGETMRLQSLARLFRIPDAVEDPAQGLVVVVEHGDEKVALLVDALLGQQQVVVKTIAASGISLWGFSGTTVLSNGRVALILEVNDICSAGAFPPATQRAWEGLC